MKLFSATFTILTVFLLSCNVTSNESPSETDIICVMPDHNDSISLDKELSQFEGLSKKKTGVYVLEDGASSLVTRAWLSEYAETSIDIQYFIFSTDNIGLIALDYLVRAADRGVKVRILVDDIMLDADIEDIASIASHENIEIKVYNPGVNVGKNIFEKIGKFASDFRSANQRMHNKTFIVDGKVVITGGRNIADEYFDFDHEFNFRDRDVLLLGTIIPTVEASFSTYWENDICVSIEQLVDIPKPKQQTFKALHEYACNPKNFWPQVRERIKNLPEAFEEIRNTKRIHWIDQVEFIADIPGKNDGSEGLGGGGVTTDKLIELVQHATSSVDIQSPYLITTEKSRSLFKKMVDRGVKIRILTNSLGSTDNIEAFSGYQRDRDELLATGVQIFEFKPDAKESKEIMTSALQEKSDFNPIFGLHAKTMAIDGQTVVIGTFNLDPRSANLNTECLTIIHDKTITQDVLEIMNTAFLPENSWKITTNFNPDSEVGTKKRIDTWTRKIVPKGIL